MGFARCDRAAPIFEIAQIDAADRYAGGIDLIQDPKQLFPRGVQDHDNVFARFDLHSGIIAEI